MKRWSCIVSIKLAVFLIVLVLVFSCASQPGKLEPISYSANVKKVDEKGILAINSNKYINPFIEPGSLLRGKVNEFAVFQIDFSIDKMRTIRVDSIMYDREKNYIEAYDREMLISYWDLFVTRSDSQSVKNHAKKVNLIENIVLPKSPIVLHPGNYKYYIIFVGPYPIKKPAQIQIDVSTSMGEYESFKFTIQ